MLSNGNTLCRDNARMHILAPWSSQSLNMKVECWIESRDRVDRNNGDGRIGHRSAFPCVRLFACKYDLLRAVDGSPRSRPAQATSLRLLSLVSSLCFCRPPLGIEHRSERVPGQGDCCFALPKVALASSDAGTVAVAGSNGGEELAACLLAISLVANSDYRLTDERRRSVPMRATG